MSTILPYNNIYPKISPNSFVAPNCSIIGDVEISDGCGIWFNSVIRADVCHIKIGDGTNIQDGSVIHVTRYNTPTIIGSGVTIGHKSLLHGCIIEDNSFIGMGAIILDNARVESGGMVAAGSFY